MQLPPLGTGVDAEQLARRLTRLTGHLYEGEQLLAVVGTRLLHPPMTHVAVSSVRLLGLDALTQLGPQRSVRHDGADVALVGRRAARLRATWRATGAVLSFGAVDPVDVPLLRDTLDLLGRGTVPAVGLPSTAPGHWSRTELLRAGRQRCWPGTSYVGGRPSDMTVRTILRHCRPGEYPWLVLESRGALVAWSDRLAIVKPGLARDAAAEHSYGPATVIDYGAVTDLEYLAEAGSGVLVVHSPRFAPYGIGGVRSDDPFRAPNAMVLDRAPYLAAQQHLDRLNALVSTARRHAG
ncbi:MAG: hypothetical protein WCA46_09785 [Actinocatenispora sp.]